VNKLSNQRPGRRAAEPDGTESPAPQRQAHAWNAGSSVGIAIRANAVSMEPFARWSGSLRYEKTESADMVFLL
jgi:hypothetical protein